jgi:hypothetical protein
MWGVAFSFDLTNTLSFEGVDFDDADDDDNDEEMSQLQSPPRRAAGRRTNSKQIFLGDSVDNDFFVIQVPSVEVKEGGKDIMVTLLQLGKLLHMAADAEQYRLVLDDDGFGCTLHYPRMPMLNSLSNSKVVAMAQNMATVLADRTCTQVEDRALLNNHKALFTFLKAKRADKPESMMLQQHYSFVNESGKVQCSLDYFNEDTNTKEIQGVPVPFYAAVDLGEEGIESQDLYLLVWQLCIANSNRVVTAKPDKRVSGVLKSMKALRVSKDKDASMDATGG